MQAPSAVGFTTKERLLMFWKHKRGLVLCVGSVILLGLIIVGLFVFAQVKTIYAKLAGQNPQATQIVNVYTIAPPSGNQTSITANTTTGTNGDSNTSGNVNTNSSNNLTSNASTQVKTNQTMDVVSVSLLSLQDNLHSIMSQTQNDIKGNSTNQKVDSTNSKGNQTNLKINQTNSKAQIKNNGSLTNGNKNQTANNASSVNNSSNKTNITQKNNTTVTQSQSNTSMTAQKSNTSSMKSESNTSTTASQSKNSTVKPESNVAKPVPHRRSQYSTDTEQTNQIPLITKQKAIRSDSTHNIRKHFNHRHLLKETKSHQNNLLNNRHYHS